MIVASSIVPPATTSLHENARRTGHLPIIVAEQPLTAAEVTKPPRLGAIKSASEKRRRE